MTRSARHRAMELSLAECALVSSGLRACHRKAGTYGGLSRFRSRSAQITVMARSGSERRSETATTHATCMIGLRHGKEALARGQSIPPLLGRTSGHQVAVPKFIES